MWIVGMIFSVSVTLLTVHGSETAAPRLWRHGRRIALAYSEAYTLAVALTSFAVVESPHAQSALAQWTLSSNSR